MSGIYNPIHSSICALNPCAIVAEFRKLTIIYILKYIKLIFEKNLVILLIEKITYASSDFISLVSREHMMVQYASGAE